jgi:hypothetical protein
MEFIGEDDLKNHDGWLKCKATNRTTATALIFLISIAVAITISIRAIAQNTSIDGMVVSKTGEPLARVTVYGSQGPCCPVTRQDTRTDGRGRFHLNRPGAVIHFERMDLQPQAMVVQQGVAEVHVTMEPSSTTLIVGDCKPTRSGETLVGFGPISSSSLYRDELPTLGMEVLTSIMSVTSSSPNEATITWSYGLDQRQCRPFQTMRSFLTLVSSRKGT